MNFKDSLAMDIGIFMNPDEFGEEHIVENKPMTIVIDNNELTERAKQYKDEISMGVHKSMILMYVKASDFGELPFISRVIELDNEFYTVIDVIDENGIYSITLLASRS